MATKEQMKNADFRAEVKQRRILEGKCTYNLGAATEHLNDQVGVSTMCKEHHALDLAWKAKSKAKRKNAGLCFGAGCSVQVDRVGIVCSSCATKAALEKIVKEQDSISKNECIQNGCHTIPEEGYKVCPVHLAKSAARARRRKERNIKEHRCFQCSKIRESVSSKYCNRCFFMVVAKRHLGSSEFGVLLEAKFNSQNGKCVYSGLPMTIGVNASLDHIVPTARGGSKTDINNLQWVLLYINRIKNDMLEEEFLALVRVVAARFPGVTDPVVTDSLLETVCQAHARRTWPTWENKDVLSQGPPKD